MRSILLLVIALILSACGSSPATPLSASSRGSVAGFATLASFGTWEMELAPAYTRLASLRHRAASQLDAVRIDLATAKTVQDLADRARSALDASRRGHETEPTAAQRDSLSEARRLMDQIATLLEH